jgi:dephospho-CoA kinase
VTKKALQTALDTGKALVFLEGMRSWPEIGLIRKDAQTVVIAFIAPHHTRRERIISRGRTDDSPDAFAARDQREIAYGAAVPIALADEYILNTGSIHEAIEALDGIVQGCRGEA